MIRAVFFDIDDTLFNFSETNEQGNRMVEKYIEEKLAVSPEKWREVVLRAQEIMGTRLGYDAPAFHNRQIRYQNALECLKKPIYPYATEAYGIYWDTVIENAVPAPGVRELLEELKKRGIYLGIGSDMTSYIQNKKLDKTGLAGFFDSIITSEEVGIDKPGAPIFRLCMEKAGCQPHECVFVGDNPAKDVAGAVTTGMKAICYTYYSKAQIEETENVKSVQSYDIETFLKKAGLE